VIAVIGWIIANPPFSDPGPPGPPPQPPLPPNQPPIAQRPDNPLPASKGGGKSTTSQQLRAGCNLPPVGETRFVPTEVILDIPASASSQARAAIAAKHSMTQVETTSFRLTGRTLHRWRIDGGGSVADMIRNICAGDRLVAGAQPNYLYALAQEQAEPVNSDQYAPQKLNLPEAHRLAKGNRVLVAVIDSEVDASHPDLAGAITANFDAAGDGDRGEEQVDVQGPAPGEVLREDAAQDEAQDKCCN